MRDRLTNYFKAAYPAIAINTFEEQRAQADVIAAAKKADRKVATWSVTEGVKLVSDQKDMDDTYDLEAACATFLKDEIKNTVLILRDAHNWGFDRSPSLARRLRDLLQWCPEVGSCVVLISPSFKPYADIEKLVVVTDYTLPDKKDLRKIAEGVKESAEDTAKDKGEKVPKLTIDDDVIRALGGLSTTEAENALSLAYIESGAFTPSVIYREKTLAVRKSGLLDIVEADARGLDAIGGLEALKAWITKRREAYSDEAEKYGLPSPKGVLLVGVPGTGKSLSAKAFGTALGVPTLRLDVGSLFNSLVGVSEQRTREALKLAEALAPCVLWCDEIDKGLAGASGSGSNDSGVTKRVFGTIISWLQERRRPVFLVATANDVTGLPPELLRKGRFDEIFAIDLPRADERLEIFKIQIKARRRDPAIIFDNAFKMVEVVETTKDFTGSEIEAVVVEAMFHAFDDGVREITADDLVMAARATTPLIVTAKEQIDGIRQWAQKRARFASSPATESTANGGRRKLG